MNIDSSKFIEVSENKQFLNKTSKFIADKMLKKIEMDKEESNELIPGIRLNKKYITSYYFINRANTNKNLKSRNSKKELIGFEDIKNIFKLNSKNKFKIIKDKIKNFNLNCHNIPKIWNSKTKSKILFNKNKTQRQKEYFQKLIHNTLNKNSENITQRKKSVKIKNLNKSIENEKLKFIKSINPRNNYQNYVKPLDLVEFPKIKSIILRHYFNINKFELGNISLQDQFILVYLKNQFGLNYNNSSKKSKISMILVDIINFKYNRFILYCENNIIIIENNGQIISKTHYLKTFLEYYSSTNKIDLLMVYFKEVSGNEKYKTLIRFINFRYSYTKIGIEITNKIFLFFFKLYKNYKSKYLRDKTNIKFNSHEKKKFIKEYLIQRPQLLSFLDFNIYIDFKYNLNFKIKFFKIAYASYSIKYSNVKDHIHKSKIDMNKNILNNYNNKNFWISNKENISDKYSRFKDLTFFNNIEDMKKLNKYFKCVKKKQNNFLLKNIIKS